MKRYLIGAFLVILIVVTVVLFTRPKDTDKQENREVENQKLATIQRDRKLSEEEKERLEKLGIAVKNIRRLPFIVQREGYKVDDTDDKGTIVGIVRDSDNRALKGCIITLRGDKEPFTSARRTDMSGKFFFEKIKSGNYKLMVHCQEGKAERDGVIVEKDKVNNIEIILEKKEMVSTSVILGNVIDFVTRSPVEGAVVNFIGKSESSSEITTDSLGRFSVNVSSPQKGRLIIQKEGYIKKNIEIDVNEKEITLNNILLVKGNIKNEGQRYQGIGAALIEKNGEFVVTNIFENSPAEKAGLQKNDRIYQINGMDISSLRLDEVIALIRGDERTNVILTIKRGDEIKNIQVVRDVIEIK